MNYFCFSNNKYINLLLLLFFFFQLQFILIQNFARKVYHLLSKDRICTIKIQLFSSFFFIFMIIISYYITWLIFQNYLYNINIYKFFFLFKIIFTDIFCYITLFIYKFFNLSSLLIFFFIFWCCYFYFLLFFFVLLLKYLYF